VSYWSRKDAKHAKKGLLNLSKWQYKKELILIAQVDIALLCPGFTFARLASLRELEKS